MKLRTVYDLTSEERALLMNCIDFALGVNLDVSYAVDELYALRNVIFCSEQIFCHTKQDEDYSCAMCTVCGDESIGGIGFGDMHYTFCREHEAQTIFMVDSMHAGSSSDENQHALEKSSQTKVGS